MWSNKIVAPLLLKRSTSTITRLGYPPCFLEQIRSLASTTTTSTVVPPQQASSILNERPRRSLFSCPGAAPKFITKAQTLGADAVVLDLEDGVALEKKKDARILVTETLQNKDASFGNSELCVRINSLDTGRLALEDLQSVLPCERLDAIVLPKVEKASDVAFVSQMMDSLSPANRDVRIIAAIESALGLLNLREIAATSSEGRLDALVFASEDYCADLEAIRTDSATELLFARSQLVTTAKAYGLQAIDMVHIQFRDLEALEDECQRGRELGFTGKQAIHPSQVDTIHRAFSPSKKDVNFATLVVDEYQKTTAEGQGACVVDGMVVDFPVYKWAVKILKRAKNSGVKPDL